MKLTIPLKDMAWRHFLLKLMHTMCGAGAVKWLQPQDEKTYTGGIKNAETMSYRSSADPAEDEKGFIISMTSTGANWFHAIMYTFRVSPAAFLRDSNFRCTLEAR
jgi:hypothetical protein